MEDKIQTLIIVAVCIIFGTILITAVANQIAPMTTTYKIGNATYTAGDVNASLTIAGQAYEGTPIITNASSGAKLAANKYTITNTVLADNTAGISLKITDLGTAYAGQPVNVTYIQEPIGYSNGSTQTVILLILIFMALGIIGIAIYPAAKELMNF